MIMATETFTDDKDNNRGRIQIPYTEILRILGDGPLTVILISKITGLKPCIVYNMLRRLVAKGVVEKYDFFSKSGNLKMMYKLATW